MTFSSFQKYPRVQKEYKNILCSICKTSIHLIKTSIVVFALFFHKNFWELGCSIWKKRSSATSQTHLRCSRRATITRGLCNIPNPFFFENLKQDQILQEQKKNSSPLLSFLCFKTILILLFLL